MTDDAHPRDSFAEVAVTLPVPGRYHYRVPPRLLKRAVVGARVLVAFGSRKVTGVIVRSDVAPPAAVVPVDLGEVLDDEPALSHELVELCLWVADYYEAPPGEAIRAALPAGSGIAARVVVALTPLGREVAAGLGSALPSKQRDLLAQLAKKPLRLASLSDGEKRAVDALRERGLVGEGEQRDTPRVRLKRERMVELVAGVDLTAARVQLARTTKRLAVFEVVVGAVRAGHGEGGLPIASLVAQIPGAAEAVRELDRAKLVRVYERERRLDALPEGEVVELAARAAPPVLTGEQDIAVAEIVAQVVAGAAAAAAAPEVAASSRIASAGGADVDAPHAAKDDEPDPVVVPRRAYTPFLLHGVTGSGKTEVYLRVIAAALAAGQTALVLVPEISLTPQLASRFRSRFGELVAILHSGMSEQQRLGEWSRLRRGEARIAVGARSAVFAPVTGLGVIVVDEEHDGSFKQDEGVRYHARDVALVRAQRAGAVCVLGSATPSLESFAHATRGNYRLLTLTERPTARPMPHVDIIDLRTHMPDGDAMLSAPLRAAIATTLAAGDQIILFLNRRGFATFVLCRGCGHTFRCPHCSVSLTYHRHSDRLSCHYCGFMQRVPDVCPSCSSRGTIERKGLGTEKVADAVGAAFPSARVARLDRDVATGSKIEAVLARVARREVDVLVGTQMVTKGHDFPGVTLVGVLCADTGLNIPDFRASERTFQLLTQVAGRAGRGDKPGRVLVQTYRPHAHAVIAAAAHDYASFFTAELAARAELGYPPHGRLIAVRIDGADAALVQNTAERLAQHAETLARGHAVDIRGPVAAPLERLRGRTRWQIWLRAADRTILRRIARAMVAAEVASAVRVGLDVDPLSSM